MIGSERYRNQFRSADLQSLSCNQLTKTDLVAGHQMLRHSVNPQISLHYAVTQSHASCVCANAIIAALVAYAHKP